MRKRNMVFNWGFTCSTILLVTVTLTGVDVFSDLSAAREIGFAYVGTSALFRWTLLAYVILNAPAVILAAVGVAILSRTLQIPVSVAVVAWLPFCASVSAFWWKWIAARMHTDRDGTGAK